MFCFCERGPPEEFPPANTEKHYGIEKFSAIWRTPLAYRPWVYAIKKQTVYRAKTEERYHSEIFEAPGKLSRFTLLSNPQQTRDCCINSNSSRSSYINGKLRCDEAL